MLIQAYHKDVASEKIHYDAKQVEILSELQTLSDNLAAAAASSSCSQKGWRSWLPRQINTTSAIETKGIYLYGAVGRGKTYLMDLFYHYVPILQKQRLHFHAFIKIVDQQLRQKQGHKDPLQRIAKEWAKTTRLLCLDEFLVQDVAQAMILAELLPALLKENVTLVTTSNTRPDNLYEGGVQRVRFLPVIDLLKHHCQVLSLAGEKDYRCNKRILEKTYWSPLNEVNAEAFQKQFTAIATPQGLIQSQGTVTIQNRDIPFVQRGQSCIWFEFSVLCGIPRNTLDYLDIAEQFKWLFLSNMPALNPDNIVPALLLSQLIDVLYEKHVHLTLSAEVPLENLYPPGKLLSMFARTQSRLQEMQSSAYLTEYKCTH